MTRGHDTLHSSFSTIVGITALVMTASALLLAGCATSPVSDQAPEATSTKADKADKAETTTVEKPAPSENDATATENDEEEASDGAAGTAAGTTSRTAAAPSYPPEKQEHIQELEDGLKPLKAIPSKRE